MTKEARLLGFNLTRIEAEKKQNFSGKLEVNSNIDIKHVEKYKPEPSKEDTLKIDFSFDVNYGDLGKISLEGTLYLLLDNKLFKEVLNSWKNKKLPEDVDVFVLNIIVAKASIKAFQIEEELGLPIHIQLPVLRKQASE